MKLEAQISSVNRQLWMKSAERKAALLRTRKACKDNSKKKWVEQCERCGKSAYIGEKEFKIKKDGTKSKVRRSVLVVHHLDRVPNVWADDYLRRLHCPSDRLEVLCNACHEKEHKDLD